MRKIPSLTRIEGQMLIEACLGTLLFTLILFAGAKLFTREQLLLQESLKKSPYEPRDSLLLPEP